MPILTDTHCEAKVTKRTKIYDKGPSRSVVPGLYIDIVPARGARLQVATFCFKRPYVRIGVYQPAGSLQEFTVKEARIAARAIQNRIESGEDISLSAQRERALQQQRDGMTVDKLIALRIDYIKTPVRKLDDKMRPRIETWENVASHLRRFISPRLGRKLVAEVKRADIVSLADDIAEGSPSNARHMCMAASGLFNWAIEKEFISSSPAIRLGKWTDTKKRNTYRRKHKRTLNPSEIKIFWHGLDREDLPHTRHTRLALKFELATMLRGCEFLPLRKDEVRDLDTAKPYIHVPLERVKKRDHDLHQPLSTLAVEIIREALKDNDTDYVFPTLCYRWGSRHRQLINKHLSRTATSAALRDRDGKKGLPGLCTLLGLKKFTGHDVRRTAASLARSHRVGASLSKVSMCLDHTIKREDGIEIPAVTREHYAVGDFVEDAEMAEKRDVLEKLSAELRRIVALAPACTNRPDEAELAMAA
jgi:hypothetical protein